MMTIVNGDGDGKNEDSDEDEGEDDINAMAQWANGPYIINATWM